jgi:2-C-methyl-D-erythritol 2,4-cyclodiphosphate synthase
LLGAGQLFPDTDAEWKGASSDRFLVEAMRRCRLAGYEIGNLDATLIAQKPKLSPHKAAIKASLVAIMGVHDSVINIKAKTHEKVDAVGEERAIACHAVVLLIKQ